MQKNALVLFYRLGNNVSYETLFPNCYNAISKAVIKLVFCSANKIE